MRIMILIALIAEWNFFFHLFDRTFKHKIAFFHLFDRKFKPKFDLTDLVIYRGWWQKIWRQWNIGLLSCTRTCRCLNLFTYVEIWMCMRKILVCFVTENVCILTWEVVNISVVLCENIFTPQFPRLNCLCIMLWLSKVMIIWREVHCWFAVNSAIVRYAKIQVECLKCNKFGLLNLNRC